MLEMPMHRRWLVVTLALLCVSIFVNYVDRGNLSTAAPLLKSELHISGTQLGYLLSAFFMTYMLGHFVSGWLVDRFESFAILLVGFVLWSLATFLTGLVSAFATLFALRLVLGSAESAAYPACARIIARYVPERQRGISNGAIFAAQALGPAFGTLVGGLVMSHFGWRPFFIWFGLLSFIWVVPWLAFGRRLSTLQDTDARVAPSYATILRTPTLWGTVVAAIAQVYPWYLMLTWIPFYLVRERHLSISTMAVVGGIVYLGHAVGSTVGGSVADAWIRSGASPTRARKTVLVICNCLASASLLACALLPNPIALAFLVLAATSYGACPANAFASVQCIAGPRAAGRWIGVWNGFAQISGIIAPALTGYLLDRTGNFVLPFAAAAAMAVIAAAAWILFAGPIEEIDWSKRAVDMTPAVVPK